ncbi:hypothetical protein ACFXTI_000007 [Malus domestica]
MHQKALIDLEYGGLIFTWERNWDEWGKIKERLDRAIVNLLWMECSPNTVISHDPLIGFDHRTLIIQSALVVALSPYPFSLEAFWLRNYGFLSVVKEARNENINNSFGYA